MSLKAFAKQYFDDKFGKCANESKPSKYGNKKTEIDGKVFDSQGEGNRYFQLRILQRAGHIKDLKCQVKFELEINGVKICNYIADFTYLEDGRYVVEDFKGMRTQVYKIKKRLMYAILGVEIRETGSK